MNGIKSIHNSESDGESMAYKEESKIVSSSWIAWQRYLRNVIIPKSLTWWQDVWGRVFWGDRSKVEMFNRSVSYLLIGRIEVVWLFWLVFSSRNHAVPGSVMNPCKLKCSQSLVCSFCSILCFIYFCVVVFFDRLCYCYLTASVSCPRTPVFHLLIFSSFSYVTQLCVCVIFITKIFQIQMLKLAVTDHVFS